MDKNKPKGFTLIELLVVIAILATLAVAVTLILNPAELVRQGRDSTRLSDLSALQSAVSLFLADQAEASFSDTQNCTASSPNSPPTMNTGSCTSNSSTTVDGSGWIDIDFTQISSGAPLSNLPTDPVNDNDNYYVWLSNTSEEYEINANMESTRYANTGGDDVESTDGGNDDDWYEIGNDPDLNL